MQFGQLRRREFITLLGGAAAWPLAAHAQQPVMPMIGFLSSRASSGSATLIAAFHQGLKEAGYVEGQNTMIAFRWAEGHYDRLPALAAELVGMRVTVMVAAGGGPTPRVARAATTTIPIVFMTGDDPVAVGLVESFNRPGGNATGVSQLAIAMEAKRLEILRELIPKISVIAMLINPNNPQSSVQSKEISDAARVIGVQLHILNASTEQDFETVFPMLIRQQTEALIVGADPFFTSRSEHLAALSARYMVPAIYPFREFIASGGLMSYGASLRDVYRWVGIYAGRVLNGARPAELPVLQPTKFELVINLKTAKALGLDVPATVLSRADEVIE